MCDYCSIFKDKKYHLSIDIPNISVEELSNKEYSDEDRKYWTPYISQIITKINFCPICGGKLEYKENNNVR